MNPVQPPRTRPRSTSPTMSDEERRIRRGRWLVGLAIVLIGLAIIVWDFLRPPRTAVGKPPVPPAATDGQR